MKVWNIKDFPGHLISTIDSNKSDLPNPLPWIEPSINNLYLESCSCFLLGNYTSSIITASILLEHTLRLAIIDKDNCGLKRTESIETIDKFRSLTNVIDEAVTNTIFSGCNEQWWRDTAKYIRNKSAHYLLPMILRDCAKTDSFSDYIREEVKEENNSKDYYEKFLIDWGAFYHKDDRYFALHFLEDVFKELSIVIGNTDWVGDESWWISQKFEYDSFFDHEWSYDKVIESMTKARKELGSK